ISIQAERMADVPEAARETLVQDLAAIELRRPFDLERGPLIRPRLVRLGENDHLLMVTRHHIVTDGWSTGVLIRELAALYNAFAAGMPTPLPALPLAYGDYAVWQRERLRSGSLDPHLRYWREQL